MKKENGAPRSLEKGNNFDTGREYSTDVETRSVNKKPDAFTQFMRDLANTRNHPYFFERLEET